MPASYSMETLPKPNNHDVKLKHTLAHSVAVIRSNGYTSEHKIEKMTHELREWATEHDLELVGLPTVSRYDPPWKPGFMRRNEVSLVIK